MMKKTGFTLIEIIVVLIILGVLAGLALPSYFGWVESSRQAEAIVSIKSIREQIKAYILSHPNASGFDPSASTPLGALSSAQLQSPHFQYIAEAINVVSGGVTTRQILAVAIRNCVAGGTPIFNSTGTAYNMIWYGEVLDDNFNSMGAVGSCGYGVFGNLVGNGSNCAASIPGMPFGTGDITPFVTIFLSNNTLQGC